MNNRALMKERTYIMYHDINWYSWKERRWHRYDNMRGKPPKKRWTIKISLKKLSEVEE